MTNNGHSKIVAFSRLDSPYSRLRRSAIAPSRPVKASAARIGESDEHYLYRMFASALVAAFVGMLVISGQWMFAILARMP